MRVLGFTVSGCRPKPETRGGDPSDPGVVSVDQYLFIRGLKFRGPVGHVQKLYVVGLEVYGLCTRIKQNGHRV